MPRTLSAGGSSEPTWGATTQPPSRKRCGKDQALRGVDAHPELGARFVEVDAELGIGAPHYEEMERCKTVAQVRDNAAAGDGRLPDDVVRAGRPVGA
jgi:hypothetical protein